MVREELKKIHFNVLIKSEVLSQMSVSGERLNLRVVVEKNVTTFVLLCCHSSVKKGLEELPFYQKLLCSSLLLLLGVVNASTLIICEHNFQTAKYFCFILSAATNDQVPKADRNSHLKSYPLYFFFIVVLFLVSSTCVYALGGSNSSLDDYQIF